MIAVRTSTRPEYDDTDAAGERRSVTVIPEDIADAALGAQLHRAYSDISVIKHFVLRRHSQCIVCGEELALLFETSIVSTATGVRLAHAERCFIQAAVRPDDFLATMATHGVETLGALTLAEQRAAAEHDA